MYNDFDPEIQAQVIRRCEETYRMIQSGNYLNGICPDCDKKSLFTSINRPYVLKCHHENKCDSSFCVMLQDAFSDIFDYKIIEKYPVKGDNPNRPATAFLRYRRGFSEEIIKTLDYEFRSDGEQNLKNIPVIRFKLANGSYFSKAIDKREKGEDDSSFKGAFGNSYWTPPKQQINKGDVVFMTEAILKAIGQMHINLDDPFDPGNKNKLSYQIKVASAMNASNFPLDLINANLDKGIIWVLCQDNDIAGRKNIPKHYNKLIQLNQKVIVALTSGSDDWDTELQHERLTPQYINESLWRGRYFMAKGPKEKAFWLYLKNKSSNEVFNHANSTWHSNISKIKIAPMLQALKGVVPGCDAESTINEVEANFEKCWTDFKTPDQWKKVFDIYCQCSTVIDIANCTFELLHVEVDEHSDTRKYVIKLEFASGVKSQIVKFTGAGLKSASSFTEQLFNNNDKYGHFSGSPTALTILLKKLTRGKPIKVITVPFVGYDNPSGIYVFTDFGFADGKMLMPNDHGALEHNNKFRKTTLSGEAAKFVSSDKFNGEWFNLLYEVCGINGIITLAWLVGCLFFRQIIKLQASFPFLEITGANGSGKSMLLVFLFKLLGKADFEGFNPSNSTYTGVLRKIEQMANLPISMTEAERPDGKCFSYETILDAYKGLHLRSKGVATSDAKTIDVIANGGIIVSQNASISGTDQLLSRFIHCHFTKDHHTDESIEKAQKFELLPIEDLCGFLKKVICMEAEILSKYQLQYVKMNKLFRDAAKEHGSKIDTRQIQNHSQMAALVHTLALIFPQCTINISDKVTEHLLNMCIARQKVINQEDGVLNDFMETFDWLSETYKDSDGKRIDPVNHSSDARFIAIKIAQYSSVARQHVRVPDGVVLIKAFKTSKVRKYLGMKQVWSKIDKKNCKCHKFLRSPDELRALNYDPDLELKGAMDGKNDHTVFLN